MQRFGHVRAAHVGDAFLLGLTECMLPVWAGLCEEHNWTQKLLVKMTLQEESAGASLRFRVAGR